MSFLVHSVVQNKSQGGGEIDITSSREKLKKIMDTFSILQMMRNKRDESGRNQGKAE